MNIDKTIMSQYEHSPRLMAIIQSLYQGIDPDKFTEQYYRLIMSIPTANDVGLNIWGQIVGISRTVTFSNPDSKVFGFSDGFYPFNQAPFSAAGSTQGAWELSTEAYRRLILLKAMSNIIYATVININRLLGQMFEGNAYALFVGHMALRYIFEFDLSPYERHLVYNADILPRPCGVLINIIINLNPDGIFGFNGQGLQPFNQGVFYDATA